MDSAARDPFYIRVLRCVVKEIDLARVHKGSGVFAAPLDGRESAEAGHESSRCGWWMIGRIIL